MIDESKLFFEEAFADIALSKVPSDNLVLRLGRQEFELGDGRLVDVREGPNVRQTFDGASLNWKASSWNVRGFALKPVLNGTGVFDAPPDHGSTFWGVYAVHPMPKIKGGKIDLYYLGLARKDAVFDIGSADELRHTVGGRLSGSRGGWSYDSEAAFQGALLAHETSVPGAPATVRRTHFNPSVFGLRLAPARLSPAAATAIQSRTSEL